MAGIETTFQLIREGNKIVGFSLLSQASTESDFFCDTFPCAFAEGKAEIRFKDDEIVFDHPTCRHKGRCAHTLNEKEIEALKEILGQQFKVENALSMRVGFQIVLA